MSHGPFFIFLLVFGYFQAGYWLAKISWKVWYERETPGVLGYLLFPLSAAKPGFSAANMSNAMLPIDEFVDPRRYELWMAVCWPLKIGWNMLALTALGCMGICLGAATTLKLLVFGPERLVRWMTAAAKAGHVRQLGGTGGTLPVAVPQAHPPTEAAAMTEGGGHGIR